MLFSTPAFIFLFLPITFCLYFIVNYYKCYKVAQLLLIGASLYFYAHWNVLYLPLLIVSILGNYYFGEFIQQSKKNKKQLLIAGIIFNLGLLGYFKYTDFFISTMNAVLATEFPLLKILLPLALSFCTFQQIAYLVDIYRGDCKSYGLRSYFLFVSFFPQQIAGPIVHHKEMMPQFEDRTNWRVHGNNILLGIAIFSIGLFKKVVIADSFAVWANWGFENYKILDFWDAWKTSLSYTFQLYYDFSGYADMAIGAALLFNIRLPSNFNSPYKATNIQEFWRGWHMTLSRWMRDYVYIPLGGSRLGNLLTLRNLFITAVVSGIWHGAGWTFVIWGAMHGLAIVIHRLWQICGLKMHRYLGWFCTFIFVNFAWVFFRASDFSEAMRIIRVMIGWRDGVFFTFKESTFYKEFVAIFDMNHPLAFWQMLLTMPYYLVVLVAMLILTLVMNNSTQLYRTNKVTIYQTIWIACAFVVGTIFMVSSSSPVFLYFNF